MLFDHYGFITTEDDRHLRIEEYFRTGADRFAPAFRRLTYSSVFHVVRLKDWLLGEGRGDACGVVPPASAGLLL
jgi:hypothetical protein